MSEAKRSNSEFSFPLVQQAAALTHALNADDRNRRLAMRSPGSVDSLTTEDCPDFSGTDPYNNVGRFARTRSSG